MDFYFFKNKLCDLFYSIKTLDFKKQPARNITKRKTLKSKRKVISVATRYRKLVKGREQIITAFVVGIVLMGLWFLYLIFGTWSPAKFAARVHQYDDIELPGLNPYDNNSK